MSGIELFNSVDAYYHYRLIWDEHSKFTSMVWLNPLKMLITDWWIYLLAELLSSWAD